MLPIYLTVSPRFVSFHFVAFRKVGTRHAAISLAHAHSCLPHLSLSAAAVLPRWREGGAGNQEGKCYPLFAAVSSCAQLDATRSTEQSRAAAAAQVVPVASVVVVAGSAVAFKLIN